MSLENNKDPLKNDITRQIKKIDNPHKLGKINAFIDGMKKQQLIDSKKTTK